VFSEEVGGLTPFPFIAGSSFTIRAFPQAATNIPLAATHVPAAEIVGITNDPLTGLAIVEVFPARPLWAADSLKGKFLIEAGNSDATSTIYGSDPTHLYLAIRDSGSQFIGADLDIVETSATLRGTLNAQGDGAGIEVLNCPQIAFHGITFECLDPEGYGIFAIAIQYTRSEQPRFELCDIQGFAALLVDPNFTTFACVLRDRILVADGAAWTAQRCLLLDVPFIFNAGTSGNVTTACVLDNCAALENSNAHTTDGNFPSNSWVIGQCLFKNGFDPRGAIVAQNSGLWTLEQVEINNPAGPGILCEGGVYMVLRAVAGTNLGLGIQVHDGARVRVMDDATNITGGAGDMKVGELPVRSWLNFRDPVLNPPNGMPIKNEYDLKIPFNAVSGTPGGDEETGPDTGGRSGSRLFQRPTP